MDSVFSFLQGAGMRAKAIYDYEAGGTHTHTHTHTHISFTCTCRTYVIFSAGDDEITFDPDEIIENIEQVCTCILYMYTCTCTCVCTCTCTYNVYTCTLYVLTHNSCDMWFLDIQCTCT